MRTSSLDANPRLRQLLEALKENDPEWTMAQFETYLRDWRRLEAGTIAERLRHLRRIATDPVLPVRVHGTRFELVDSFYAFMRQREAAGATPMAIKNDFAAAVALGDLRGVPRNVWPRKPTIPRKARKLLPTPEKVNALLHADYAPNPHKSYENHLVRTLLAVDLGLGPRFPSEPHALRVDHYDPANHTLLVTEPKKSHSTRLLLIEPTWLCCGRTRTSLGNFTRYWRPRVDVGGSDALFLRPDGQPFKDKLALKRWLDKRVMPVARALGIRWNLYLGRHWCANARLIDGGFNYADVANQLGHESVDRVRRDYEHTAKIHERLYGGKWLERAFKAHNPKEPAKTGVSGALSPVTNDGSVRPRPSLQESRHPRDPLISGVSGACRSPSPPLSFYPLGVAA